jgi:hypothetical protein
VEAVVLVMVALKVVDRSSRESSETTVVVSAMLSRRAVPRNLLTQPARRGYHIRKVLAPCWQQRGTHRCVSVTVLAKPSLVLRTASVSCDTHMARRHESLTAWAPPLSPLTSVPS